MSKSISLLKKTTAVTLAVLVALSTLFTAAFTADAKAKKYVKSVKVAKKSVSVKAGKTAKVKVTVKVSGKASKKFTVKSSKKSVAKAKVKGTNVVITAVKKGKAVITVTTKAKSKKGKKLTAKITANVKAGSTPTPTEPTIPVIPTEAPTAAPTAAPTEPATEAPSGATEAPTAPVTEAPSGATEAPTTVPEGTKLEKITVTAAPESIAVGATSQINVVSATEGAYIAKVEYASSNENIATVDANGVVTGKMANAAPVIITVKAYDAAGNTVNGTVGITVTGGQYPNAKISDVAENYVLAKGATRQLNPSAIDAGPEPTFNYVSDTPAVATVDDKGLITAVAAGEAKITVTVAGTTAQAVCVVTVKDSVGIASFKATHAKIFKLAFTAAVPKDDREKITITVKKGSATMDMKKEWAEDGSSVDLSTDANLEATDYTVAIASDTVSIDDENKTAKTTVEKYGIKDVKITTKRVNKIHGVRVYFDAIDNYGDKIKDTWADNFNWQLSCDDAQVKTTTFDLNYYNQDYVTLDNFGDNDNKVEVDKTVFGIQAILKTDESVKSGRVDIEVKSIKIAKVDIVDIELEGGAKHIYEETTNKTYKLVVDAVDNFGDPIDWEQYNPGTPYSLYNNEFNAYSEDKNLVSAPYFDPSTNELYIDVYAYEHGKAKIYAVAENPEYKTYDVEVLAARKPLRINFPDSSEYSLVAKEDKDVKIPVTFTDQYGDEMLKNAVDNSLFASTFSPTLSDNNLIASYDSSLEGDFVVYNAKNVSSSSTEKVNVTYSTYDDEMNLVQSSFIIKIDEERRPDSIKFKTAVPESIVVNETLNLEFQIIDNRGEAWQDNTFLTVDPITTGIDTYVHVSVGAINTDGTGTVTVTGLQDSTVNKDPKLPLKFKLTYGGDEIASTTFTPPTVTVYPNLGGTTEIQATPTPLQVNSGQTVKLTLQAMKSDTEKLTSYAHTYKDVQFTQEDTDSGKTATDFKDVVFKNGVAEVEIEAKLATDNLKFYATIDAAGYGYVYVETGQMVKVNVGTADHYNITLTKDSVYETTTVEVTCVDKNNNTVKSYNPTESHYVAIKDKEGKVVAPNDHFDSSFVDSNGKVIINFVDGVAIFDTDFHCWFNNSQVVTFTTGSITGSKTAD